MAGDITPITEEQRAAIVEKNRVVYNDMLRNDSTIDYVEAISEMGIKFADFTCHNCALVGTCQWQFDLYNIDGDCLALK